MANSCSFNKKMLQALESQMLENPGVTSVTVDGVSVNYSSLSEMSKARSHYQQLVALESGRRKMFRSVSMRNAW